MTAPHTPSGAVSAVPLWKVLSDLPLSRALAARLFFKVIPAEPRREPGSHDESTIR
jgi:hypothetical protein